MLVSKENAGTFSYHQATTASLRYNSLSGWPLESAQYCLAILKLSLNRCIVFLISVLILYSLKLCKNHFAFLFRVEFSLTSNLFYRSRNDFCSVKRRSLQLRCCEIRSLLRPKRCSHQHPIPFFCLFCFCRQFKCKAYTPTKTSYFSTHFPFQV